jgi:hypothetical protein
MGKQKKALVLSILKIKEYLMKKIMALCITTERERNKDIRQNGFKSGADTTLITAKRTD